MTAVDWSQFQDGDEVAVTFVGRVVTKDFGRVVIFGPGHPGYSFENERISGLAVDAYRVEPDPQPGDIVRDVRGWLWLAAEDNYYFGIRDNVGNSRTGMSARSSYEMQRPLTVVLPAKDTR